MIDIAEVLYQKVKSILSGWEEPGIYAISFFVESNEAYAYGGFSNVTQFMVSYNTEEDCPGAGALDEERWNYAFWRQDETPVIDTDGDSPETRLLFEWYREQGLENIGFEPEDCYDEDGDYIGKGPVGHYELLTLAAAVGRRLQEEGFIRERFQKPVPIIVHGLEYAWYDLEATADANPNGEADVFRKAAKGLFCL